MSVIPDEDGSDDGSDDELRPLHPRVVLLWRLQLAGALALFGVVPLTLLVAVLAANAAAAIGVAITVTAVAGVVAWQVPAKRYACWRYAVRDDVLELCHGWLWRQRSLVPHYRVQHIDIEQGPIERRLGLAKLELHTASAGSDASLPGIEVDRAEDIRAHVLARADVPDAV